jgi:hypothetical protein
VIRSFVESARGQAGGVPMETAVAGAR